VFKPLLRAHNRSLPAAAKNVDLITPAFARLLNRNRLM
jgi:hypothetical protein